MIKTLSLFFILAISFANAQTGNSTTSDKSSKKKIKEGRKAAIEMCNCTNSIIKDFHPLLRRFLMDMAEKSEAEAAANFKAAHAKLSQAEQTRIKEDTNRMTTINSGVDGNCLDDLKIKYNGENESEFEKAMREAINTMPKCKLTAKLMELGLRGRN